MKVIGLRSRTDEAPAPLPAPRGTPPRLWPFAGVLLAVGAAVSWAGAGQLERLLTDLDVRALERAALLYERTVEQRRQETLAQARLLADDTRIRSTVVGPELDAATIDDVLADLAPPSGARVLAVLDGAGRVRAASGGGGLRGVDLGAAPLVRESFARATAGLWSLGPDVLMIGLAPIRSGESTVGLFLIGHALGDGTLSAVSRGAGVQGVVVIGDRVVAATTGTAGLAEAARAAVLGQDGEVRVVRTDRAYAVRVTGTGRSAGAARLVWLVPRHQHGPRALALQLLVWTPLALAALAAALAAPLARRDPR